MNGHESKKSSHTYIILPLNDREKKLLAKFSTDFLSPNEHAWIIRFKTLASANFKIPPSLKQLVSMPDRFIPEIIKALKLHHYDTIYKRSYGLGRQMSLAGESYDMGLTLIGLQMISLLSIVDELSAENSKGKKMPEEKKKRTNINFKAAMLAFSKVQHNLRLVFLQSYFQILDAQVQVQHEDLQRDVERSNIRKTQEKLLRRILEETAQYLDFQELFRVFSKTIRATCKYDRVSVALNTEGLHEVKVFALSTDAQSDVTPGRIITDDCSIFPAIETKKPKIMTDTSKNKSCLQCAQLHKEGINSFVILPLLIENKVLGTLNIGSTQLAFFREGDLPFLQELANGLAVSVKNATEHSQISENLKYEQCASQVISKIRSTLQIEEVKEIVCKELTDCTNADRTCLTEVFEPEGLAKIEHEFLKPDSEVPDLLSVKNTYKMKDFQEISDFLRSGEVIAANVEGEVHPVLRSSQTFLQSLQIKTICIVPIFVFQKYWGAVAIEHCAKTYRWKKEQIEMLKKVVKEMSKALELAHIHRKEKENVARLEKIIKAK